MKHREVPIQKGKIISNPMTMKQMPYRERVSERREEIAERKSGQTLKECEPSRGRR